ncbi:MAG: membrane protein FxsA [Nitratireductor sp.]|nr:membrane protein FxsA [Nitratireductor sp.]
MPFSILPFLLLAIPVAEIAVFIVVGGQIGVVWTLACIVITAVIGSILLRVQGFQIINRLREETQAGRVPGRELGHGAMILVAGVLLLTPGFVTDTLGFLLFVPPVRDAIWRFLASRIRFTVVGGASSMAGKAFDEHFRSSGNRPEEGVVDLDPSEFHRGRDAAGEATAGEDDPSERRLGDDRNPNRGPSPWRDD